jgi:threonine dehydrogenase-like Zn-dependent dehydrogenase
MKIAILHGPGDLRLEERPPFGDDLAPDEIEVETRLTALKPGTDRGNFEGAEPVPGAPDPPRWVGDSNLGVVRATGAAVRGLRVGDRVLAPRPHQSSYRAREADRVVRVPGGVHDESAVFGHLFGLASHCYRKGAYAPGESVAVIGLGVIGLGAVALGSAYGARVAALGNHGLRLEMARRLGAGEVGLSCEPDAAATLVRLGAPAGADLVILAANSWDAYRTALDVVRPGGRVAIVALVGRGEPPAPWNPLAMEWFYEKGISLVAVNGPAPELHPAEPDGRDWQRGCEHVLSLMDDGRIEPKRLVTHRFHWSEIPEAYALLARRDKSVTGALFDWADAER